MYNPHEAKIIGISSLIACLLYFSGFLVILTPVPLMYVWIARGQNVSLQAAGLASLAVALIYFLFSHTAGAMHLAYIPMPGQGMAEFMPSVFVKVFGVGYFACFAAIGLTLAWGTRQRLSLMRWGTYALLSGLGAVTATLVVAKIFGAANLTEGLSAYVHYLLGEIARGANLTAGTQNAQLAFMADHKDQVATTIMHLMPSLIFVYVAITVALNAVVCRRILRTRGAESCANDMTGFKLPYWLIWGVICSGVVFFMDSYVLRSGLFGIFALNALICLGALYFLQGMAVTIYFMRRIRFSLIRTLAYIAMIVFLQTVSIALVVLGIADVWADFRLRRWRLLHEQSK